MYYNTYYDINDLQQKPQFWICKPNKQTVGKLVDVYNAQYTLEGGGINKLNFTIPAVTMKNHTPVTNPQVELIREYYLIRMKFQKKIEYFSVIKISKNRQENGFESVNYQCYSLGYEISQTLIRDYDETSKTLSFLATDILKYTNWTLDYVDADFDLTYRSYQATSSNALQCIFDIAIKFNAIVLFDTVAEKVSFYKAKNLGKNKGIVFRDGIYLESFDLNIDPEAMVTRLSAYGQDGLEFRRLSPTGTNYIEDYSFFMYPFEADSNYNVIKSSKWMTDELCIALLKYYKLVDSKQGQFDSLVTLTTQKNAEIGVVEQQIATLEAERKNLLNQRDVINYTYADKAPERQEWQNVIAQLNSNQSQLDAQNAILNTKKTELQAILNTIQDLRESIKVENHFSPQLIEEWKKYIFWKEHFNDSIIEDKDLLEETKEIFEEKKEPPLNLNLSIENFLVGTEPNFDRTRLGIFDTAKLKSKDLGIFVKARITEMVFNFDNHDIAITVSNTVKDSSDLAKYIESMKITAGTSTVVENDRFKWNEGREAKDELTKYINSVFDATKQLIQGGQNGSVVLNERGLVAIDLANPNAWLMIQNGQMFITPDNGNTVSVAINKDGVHAERLIGRIILGNKLHIEDELGVVLIENGAVKTFDLSGQKRVQLGRYEDPDNTNVFKYGLRIYDGALDIRTSENANRGVQFDGDGIRAFNNNGVPVFTVDAVTGFVSIVGNLSIKSSYSSNAGIEIDGNGIRGYMSGGQIGFSIDNYGNATFGGKLTYATGAIDNVTGSVDNLTGSVSQMTGDVLNLTGSISAMQGTFAGVVTGSLSAETIDAIRIKADQIDALIITADKIQVNDLSAISANMGNITSGNININENMYIGRELTIGASYLDTSPKRINFGNATGGYIQHQNDVLKLGALDGVEIDNLRIRGTLDVSGAQLIGFP